MTKEQWDAIKNRDASYDGQLYYALRPSRKVCRPSCPKAQYDPAKVVLFDTLEEALSKGYHPCSRCHPEIPDWVDAKTTLSRHAEALIRSHYTEKFSLPALAAALHVDKSYLLRSFKEVTGDTLLSYHNKVRCEAAEDLLTHSELSISYIASAVGFVSASHFAQVFRKIRGCSPSMYRERYLQSLDD